MLSLIIRLNVVLRWLGIDFFMPSDDGLSFNDAAGYAALKEALFSLLSAQPAIARLQGPAGTGKTFLSMCFAGEFFMPVVRVDGFKLDRHGTLIRRVILLPLAYRLARHLSGKRPSIVLIEEVVPGYQDFTALVVQQARKYPAVVTIATTNNERELSAELSAKIAVSGRTAHPDAAEREQIINASVRRLGLSTVGLNVRDLSKMLDGISQATVVSIVKVACVKAHARTGKLQRGDLLRAIRRYRQLSASIAS